MEGTNHSSSKRVGHNTSPRHPPTSFQPGPVQRAVSAMSQPSQSPAHYSGNTSMMSPGHIGGYPSNTMHTFLPDMHQGVTTAGRPGLYQSNHPSNMMYTFPQDMHQGVTTAGRPGLYQGNMFSTFAQPGQFLPTAFQTDQNQYSQFLPSPSLPSTPASLYQPDLVQSNSVHFQPQVHHLQQGSAAISPVTFTSTAGESPRASVADTYGVRQTNTNAQIQRQQQQQRNKSAMNPTSDLSASRGRVSQPTSAPQQSRVFTARSVPQQTPSQPSPADVGQSAQTSKSRSETPKLATTPQPAASALQSPVQSGTSTKFIPQQIHRQRQAVPAKRSAPSSSSQEEPSKTKSRKVQANSLSQLALQNPNIARVISQQVPLQRPTAPTDPRSSAPRQAGVLSADSSVSRVGVGSVRESAPATSRPSSSSASRGGMSRPTEGPKRVNNFGASPADRGTPSVPSPSATSASGGKGSRATRNGGVLPHGKQTGSPPNAGGASGDRTSTSSEMLDDQLRNSSSVDTERMTVPEARPLPRPVCLLDNEERQFLMNRLEEAKARRAEEEARCRSPTILWEYQAPPEGTSDCEGETETWLLGVEEVGREMDSFLGTTERASPAAAEEEEKEGGGSEGRGTLSLGEREARSSFDRSDQPINRREDGTTVPNTIGTVVESVERRTGSLPAVDEGWVAGGARTEELAEGERVFRRDTMEELRSPPPPYHHASPPQGGLSFTEMLGSERIFDEGSLSLDEIVAGAQHAPPPICYGAAGSLTMDANRNASSRMGQSPVFEVHNRPLTSVPNHLMLPSQPEQAASASNAERKSSKKRGRQDDGAGHGSRKKRNPQ